MLVYLSCISLLTFPQENLRKLIKVTLKKFQITNSKNQKKFQITNSKLQINNKFQTPKAEPIPGIIFKIWGLSFGAFL